MIRQYISSQFLNEVYNIYNLFQLLYKYCFINEILNDFCVGIYRDPINEVGIDYVFDCMKVSHNIPVAVSHTYLFFLIYIWKFRTWFFKSYVHISYVNYISYVKMFQFHMKNLIHMWNVHIWTFHMWRCSNSICEIFAYKIFIRAIINFHVFGSQYI